MGSMAMNGDSGNRDHEGGAARRTQTENMRKKKVKLRVVWPLIWTILTPRLWTLALALLLTFVRVIASLTIPQITKRLIDGGLDAHPSRPELLPTIATIAFGATLLQAIASYAVNQLLGKAGQRLIIDLRARVQRHVGLLPVSYYDSNSTGTLVARIMSDVEGVRYLVGPGLIDVVAGILTAALSMSILIHKSPQITLTIFSIVTSIALSLRFASEKLRPIFRERGRISAEVTSRLTESLGGVRVVKGYHAEEHESKVFAKGMELLLQNILKTLTISNMLGTSSIIMTGLVTVIVILMGGRLVAIGHWTIGDYVQYGAFLAFMTAPVFQIVNIYSQLAEALAGLDRTVEILSEMDENHPPQRTVAMPPIDGHVFFDSITFAYEAGKIVLHGISFRASPGTVTALVGSSGAGKSTIISLLCGFHTPLSGHLFVDDIDLSRIKLGTYRSQLGVVLQDSFIFDGTVRDNIMFSRPDAKEEEFFFACRTARVDEFVEQFPDGYDTVVGERGVKLSGGQRQRLSIARALVADPRILILDEATSSLDSESEQLIQAGLNELMSGRTTFVIAHRLSTIRRADQILVIEEGRILESGNHQQLYALGRRYYDLYTRQHGAEANLFLATEEEG